MDHVTLKHSTLECFLMDHVTLKHKNKKTFTNPKLLNCTVVPPPPHTCTVVYM